MNKIIPSSLSLLLFCALSFAAFTGHARAEEDESPVSSFIETLQDGAEDAAEERAGHHVSPDEYETPETATDLQRDIFEDQYVDREDDPEDDSGPEVKRIYKRQQGIRDADLPKRLWNNVPR